MPSVDVNRLKGNYAQALASTWLSRMCLVRPVAEGTDIGIDLYCESIVDGVPYLHFWVQVKAIPSSSIRKEGEERTARYSFDRRHLEYWGRQPIPVYAFLVPVDSWPPIVPDAIFGVRVTEELVKQGLPTTNSITYHAKDSFGRDTLDDDLRQFVTGIVPWDTSVLLLKRGIVAPLPGHPDRYPSGIGHQYLPNILASIREASVFGLTYSSARYEGEQLSSLRNRLRRHFEEIASTFRDGMHYWGLSALAWSASADGRFETAQDYLQLARTKITNDTSLQESERSKQLSAIQELVDRFQKEQELQLNWKANEVLDTAQEEP